MSKFKSSTHAIALLIIGAVVAAAKWMHAHPDTVNSVTGIIANYSTYSLSGMGAALLAALYFPSKK